MTTWHCDKCSLRFGTYADFGDHWRTDHRKDPITERAAERAKAWDEGRESLAADIASPLLDNMTKRQTKNPYREV